MAHDGHDRRSRMQHCRNVNLIEQTFFNVRFGDASYGVAEFLGEELGCVGIDRVGDLGHLALLHQELDHVDRAFGHAVGKLLDGNCLRDRNLPRQFLLGLIGGMAFQALGAATKRCDRAFTHLVRSQCGHQREAPAAPLRSASSWLWGRRRAGGARAATCRSRGFFLVGLLNDTARIDRRGRSTVRLSGGLWLGFVISETLLGFGLGLALSLLVVAATLILFALSRLGGLAIGAFGRIFVIASTGRFFGNPPLLDLADLRFRKGMSTSRALFLGQLAQHETPWLAAARRVRDGPPGCGASRSASAAGRSPSRRGHGRRCGRRSLGDFAIARTHGPPLHFFDHNRFRTAMAEALAHHPLFDAALERQRLGWGDRQGLLAGMLGFSHYDPGSGVVPFRCREPRSRLTGLSARKYSRNRQRARNVSLARPASNAACTTFRRPNAKSN